MKFRHDINALRALAVVMVIGFHFQVAGFGNGFIGVDIFLVLSGFLVGSQALQRLKHGEFSLSNFLEMRLRRIVPALFVVVMATVLLGWHFSLPNEYLRQLRQALSAMAFVSNIAFSSESGYFAAAAQSKPLLHTWSLSVEWQFYIDLAVILLLLQRLVRVSPLVKTAPASLIVLTLASMAWCIWLSVEHNVGTYFYLLNRAWELLAGCLIACFDVFSKRPIPPVLTYPKARNALAAAGWAFVTAGFTINISENHWPGLETLWPVLGTVLLIASNAPMNRGSWLTNRLVQRLGDWSYSLYLWHWPIWVFYVAWLSRYAETATPWAKPALVMLTLLIGFISFQWVEQPFRTQRKLWTPKRLVWFSVTGFLILVLVSTITFSLQGVPQRLPDYIERAELARSVNTPRDECFRNDQSEKRAPEPYCEIGPALRPGEPSILLWGDSIANQYLDPLTRAAGNSKVHGWVATQSGCRAFLDSAESDFGVPEQCRQFNRSVFRLLESAQAPKIVVLARNWIAPEEVNPLVSKLLAMDKTVVLILPSLGLDFDVPDRWIAMQYRAGKAIDNWRLEATPELLQVELREKISKLTDSFKGNPKFIVLDPLPLVCEIHSCYLVRDGQANFRDTLHISNLNSQMYDALFIQAVTRAAAISK